MITAKIFVNKRNKQLMIALPRKDKSIKKHLEEGKIPKYIRIKKGDIKW